MSRHWDDKNFLADMEGRYREYISGKVKPISLDEVEIKAANLIKERQIAKTHQIKLKPTKDLG